MYHNCPIFWISKLQTEITLSTAEAEYIALSQAMRSVVPLITFFEELSTNIPIEKKKPIFKCTVFEDNRSCIAMTQQERFSPRTKHIALKYHFFMKFVKDKIINILPIGTNDQLADIFTKPLDPTKFAFLRQGLCGW